MTRAERLQLLQVAATLAVARQDSHVVNAEVAADLTFEIAAILEKRFEEAEQSQPK